MNDAKPSLVTGCFCFLKIRTIICPTESPQFPRGNRRFNFSFSLSPWLTEWLTGWKSPDGVLRSDVSKFVRPSVLSFRGLIGVSIVANVSDDSNVSTVWQQSQVKKACVPRPNWRVRRNSWLVSWPPEPDRKEWIQQQTLFRQPHPSLQTGAVLDRRSNSCDPLWGRYWINAQIVRLPHPSLQTGVVLNRCSDGCAPPTDEGDTNLTLK